MTFVPAKVASRPLISSLRMAIFFGLVAIAGCSSPPVPDEPRAATVTDAPVLVATADGDRVFLLIEQSLRRTEKSHRTQLGFTQETLTTHSVIRDEIWSLDPATLAIAWRQPLREYRPTGETRQPRLVGRDADAIWWAVAPAPPGLPSDAIVTGGAIAARDGRVLPDAGPAPPDGPPAGAFNAGWYFHAGPAGGDGGPLRLPDSAQVVRTHDPEGYFHLHVTPHAASGSPPPRLERRSDDGRSLWTATLPLLALKGLSTTDTNLVFFGTTDGGKVPGTQHDAQGGDVLVSVDIATGHVDTLDVGQASLLPARVAPDAR